jgi:hypothetical protein
MTEVAGRQDQRMEWEVRGGIWENLHVFVFYTAVTLAILATAGVARYVNGILCVVFLFYSIFTLYSSATYAAVLPLSQELEIDRYFYLIPSKKRIGSDKLQAVLVKESSRSPGDSEEKASKRDLSYYVRVYVLLKDGRRIKIFRSGMTGAPLDNRKKAYLITESTARILGLPVQYATPRGKSGVEELRLAGSRAE